MCEEGFHLTTRNSCISLSSPITNCYKYSSPDLCSICDPDYLLGIDQTECTEAPVFENCTSYTPLKCLNCKSGHQHNRNNYLYELLSFSSKRNLRKIEDRLLMDYDTNYRQDFSVCQPLSIAHCSVHDEFNYCAICDSGYYWKLGKCYAYPSPKIYNCVTYTAVDSCVECR